MARFRSEWKYYIDDSLRQKIGERLGAVMDRDAHADANGRYEIHSLYFDDYNDTCLNENVAGDQIRYKYRIRYYNDNPEFIFLEKKSKLNSYCKKRSCRLTRDQFNQIMEQDVGELCLNAKDKLLQEFCVAILTEGFAPKVIVNYVREAFVEPISNVRITFDNAISASDSFEHFLESDYLCVSAIPEGKSILEVKFDDVLPSYIKNLVQANHINQRAFSKYYFCRKAVNDYYFGE